VILKAARTVRLNWAWGVADLLSHARPKKSRYRREGFSPAAAISSQNEVLRQKINHPLNSQGNVGHAIPHIGLHKGIAAGMKPANLPNAGLGETRCAVITVG
jgi:hypothetical protein